MPHMLIKYAHVLICICAGEGSQHFSVSHSFIHSLQLMFIILAPPPSVKITPMATSFTIRDNIDLTCTVSADNVDGNAMAVVEWRRSGIIIDTIILSPNMESSLYNINGTTVHTITGLDLSEEGEYICSSYINSSNQYVLDSDTVNVSKSIIIEGNIVI